MDVDKLREELLKKEVYSKGDFLKEVELKRKNREEAKLKIIKKINENTVPLKMDKSISLEPLPKIEKKPSKVAVPNLKIIKPKHDKKLSKQSNIQQDTQEKLSYTLQLNKISHNQLANYRKRKINSEASIINYKLNTLNPQLTKSYIIIVAALIILIVIVFIFI